MIKINDLELIEGIDLLLDKTIVLYGAGVYSRTVYFMLKNAGIQVSFFCDGDSQKWEHRHDNVKIISPSELKIVDQRENTAIIITVQNSWFLGQIMDVLEQINIGTKNIYTGVGFEIAYAQNMNKLNISETNKDFWQKISNLQDKYLVYMRNAYTINNYIKANGFCDVIVYQSGKVGSSTIQNSLSQIGIQSFHVHFMTGHKNLIPEIEEFMKSYVDIIKNRKIKIITIIREPLSRDLSLFFQNLKYLDLSLLRPDYTFLQLCEKWMSELKMDNFMPSDQFAWFDAELKTIFGVDVFAHPFSREKGYTIIKQDNVEVLVMKLEKLNTLERVIGEFVEAPDFKLINANEGADKLYKYLYQNIKDKITIPQAAIARYYDHNLRMDHFYTQDEKKEFLKRWEKHR